MKESKCKPGGCSSLGCEGGHYCFNPDGTPKVPTPEQEAQLAKVLSDIFPDRVVEQIPPEERKGPLETQVWKQIKDLDDTYKKRVRRSKKIERYFLIALAAAAAFIITSPLGSLMLKNLGLLGN